MPELSRFFGIIIRMYLEARVEHNLAHFGIKNVDLIAGSLPRKQRRLTEAWAELHQEELLKDWELLQSGRSPKAIEPLK